MSFVRAIVLRESLVGGSLPLPLGAVEARRYPHLLDQRIPVQVLELHVVGHRAAEVALRLAEVLVPQGFYAHLVDEQMMLVVFPQCVMQVPRGDEAAADRARAVGAMFSIPARQMRFQDMFTTDHPDSAPVPSSDQVPRR